MLVGSLNLEINELTNLSPPLIREMLRIVWRDLAGWVPLAETLKILSDLANALIDANGTP